MQGMARNALFLSAFLTGCTGAIPNSTSGSNEVFTPGNGYERFYSSADHNFRYAFAEHQAPTRRGIRSERFELRDGDCGGSDCGNPRYRTEIQMPTKSNPANVGKDIWYGWSFLNSGVPSFTREDSLRLVFGQWGMPGGATPAIRLIQLGMDEGNWAACQNTTCAGSAIKRGDIVVQLADMNRVFSWGKDKNEGYVCRLFEMQDQQNRWVDLVMNTNFSDNEDGYLRIWVNGELRCNYSGAIVSPDSLLKGHKPGHRRGIFSSYTERWTKTHGAKPKPTLVVYYDEFAVGSSRSQVDPALREQSNRPAID